ncbi:CvpA family protein [Levilactobacillus spicheri]|uniref:Colicin V production protein CvpA n=2 Tax=Levilactobacillus spicheri TaxID=216463 RepID=A0A0F3RPP0_9LACO|nr:CvpA family protein [Levilactobacillus spicheri]KJW11956.1 membrane protein [Levilactobacillus spicheri]KRL46586.1 membrane ancor connecting MutS2 with cell-division Z-ring [Levilactobacillus spicheri DSM 15429]GEO65959.1 colicin V production protein CvpA [Levilactobacillus spicheri]
MLLSLGILLVLWLGFHRGYRRGLVLQVLLTVGYLAVWLVARLGARPLASGLGQFVGNLSLDSSVSTVAASQSSSFFLNGLAFSAILTVGYFVVRRVAYGLNRVTWLPVIHQVNSLAGGLINLAIRYLIIFLILNLLILLPSTSFQRTYQSSTVAQWVVKQTPVLSKQVMHWWLNGH